jgi:hypothetical protein
MSKLGATGRSKPFGTMTVKGDVGSFGARTPTGIILVNGSLTADGIRPFVPTYNGALYPTTVGNSLARFVTRDLGPPSPDSWADAIMQIYVKDKPSDCEIWVSGSFFGYEQSISSNATPLTRIFQLNETPDTVKIFMPSPVYTGGTGTYGNNITAIGSGWVDSTPFAPVVETNYGYQFHSFADAFAGPQGFDNSTAFTRPLVSFTFSKAGYEDLSVSYSVDTDAQATATDLR